MAGGELPLIILRGEIKSPPFSAYARIRVGGYLGELQQGGRLSMPLSRPMPSIGPRCHELRVRDEGKEWHILYRVDSDAVLMFDVFQKKTNETPKHLIDHARKTLREYDNASR